MRVAHLLTSSQIHVGSAFAHDGVAARLERAIFLRLSGLPAKSEKAGTTKLIGDGDGQGDSGSFRLGKSSLGASQYRPHSDLYEHLFVTRVAWSSRSVTSKSWVCDPSRRHAAMTRGNLCLAVGDRRLKREYPQPFNLNIRASTPRSVRTPPPDRSRRGTSDVLRRNPVSHVRA